MVTNEPVSIVPPPLPLTVNSFTTLNIPGIGSKKNIYNLEDERSTAYIERVEKMGLIKTRYVQNNILTEGEK